MNAHFIQKIYDSKESNTALVINGLNQLKGLNEIFEDHKEIFRRKDILHDFINEEVIDIYGLRNLVDYFNKYFLHEYNNDYKWGSTSFRTFWAEHSFTGLYDRKNHSVLVEIALSCFTKIRDSFGLVPKEYQDYISYCMRNNETMTEHVYKYENVSNYTKARFLNNFLITYFSTDEIKKYIFNVAKPLLDSKETGPRIVINYIFGTMNYGIKEHMSDIYELIIQVTFRRTYRYSTLISMETMLKEINITNDELAYYKEQRWEDADKIEKMWKSFSHEEIDNELDKANNLFMQSREQFSKSCILEKMYGISYAKSVKYYEKIFDRNDNDGYISKRFQYYYENQPQWLIDGNINEIRENKDHWRLYSHMMQSIALKTFDFSGLSHTIKEDIQSYCRFKYKPDYNIISKLSNTLYLIKAIVRKYELKCVPEITEKILLKWMHICEKDGYSGNTIRSAIYKIKEFIEYLNTVEKYKDSLIRNPASNIHVRNAHVNTKHTPYIPPEVRLAIENHINEIDLTTQLCFYIVSDTGLRFRDLMNTTINDVIPEKENTTMARFYYYDTKTSSKRIQKEQFEKRLVHISIDSYYRIQDYIEKTEYLRDSFGTETLLINMNQKGQPCAVSSTTTMNKINALIDKYNISTSMGDTWHFTNKQLRKAAAVDLISNGASLFNVKTLLDHLSIQTAEIYYAEVDKIKIMELNTEFFKNKFKIFTDEENFKYFTKEERKVLYIDFLRQHREVEFGVCCKHQSEGSCEHLGHNMCASCPKLITGKKYLSKWSDLFNDSDSRVKEMEYIYKSNGISKKDYIHFKEYGKELHLRAQYKAVINAINAIDED